MRSPRAVIGWLFRPFRSLKRILKRENPVDVANDDHGTWYREMFAPGVTAGVLRAGDLAGYRNGQVYIRRSMHVPPSPEAVRAVLGHFTFVFIRTSNEEHTFDPDSIF